MQPKTLAVQVFEQVLRKILSGELAAGTPLREVELARALGVSRTPVREALGRLLEYGVVEAKPNRGAVVRRLGRKELTDIHQVREALEGMAAELACGRLTERDFARLEALAEAAGGERAADALDAFDAELHFLIAERSGNPILAREIRKLHEMTMLIQDQSGMVPIGARPIEPKEQTEGRRRCRRQHRAIIDALRLGDSRASRRAMIAQVKASYESRIRLMSRSDSASDRGTEHQVVDLNFDDINEFDAAAS